MKASVNKKRRDRPERGCRPNRQTKNCQTARQMKKEISKISKNESKINKKINGK